MKAPKLIFGLILNLVSSILKWALQPIVYTGTMLWYIITWQPKKMAQYNWDLALSKDQYGNVLIQLPGNSWLISKDSPYPYGNPDITISAVTGKNKVEGYTIWLGNVLCAILDFFDKDHCIKAAENYEK